MKNEKEILADNPAARLLSIYSKAISIDANPDEKSGKVWASVLNVPFSPAEFFPSYAQLFTLTEEAFNTVIKFYPNQVGPHQNWHNHINTILQKFSPYHHTWKDVKSHLLNGNLGDMLQIASDGLAHYVKPTTVSELSISELKNEFTELKQSILNNSEFSDHLKKYLINELEKILYNLDHFDLYGSVPIENSIYTIYSNTELNRSNDQPLINKLGKFLLAVATSIALINDAAQLPESLEKINSAILIATIDDSKNKSKSGPHDKFANKRDTEIDIVDEN